MLQSLVQLRQRINILRIFYVFFLQVFFEFLVHFFGIELKDSRVAKDVLVVELVHLLDMKCPIRCGSFLFVIRVSCWFCCETLSFSLLFFRMIKYSVLIFIFQNLNEVSRLMWDVKR